jgi:hypothetical protein
MPLCAGLDWSGTPHPKEKTVEIDLYIPCAVSVPDIEATDGWFRDWRKELGRSIEFEFHGYRCSSKMLLKAIAHVLENGSVFAVLFDKNEMLKNIGPWIFDHPALLPPATGRMVLDRMLETDPLHDIWCDEDIGSNRRAEFNTAIKRKARSLWPTTPKIRHYPSHKSNMIQLADMMAYILQRDARGSLETEELRQRVKQLRNNNRNNIEWNNGDDLRSYL